MFEDKFAEMFGRQKVADTNYGAYDLDAFEYAHAFRGFPPAPRKCESKAELASWLLKFATACRACLPGEGA
jgi:hypothetical protein